MQKFAKLFDLVDGSQVLVAMAPEQIEYLDTCDGEDYFVDDFDYQNVEVRTDIDGHKYNVFSFHASLEEARAFIENYQLEDATRYREAQLIIHKERPF